MGLFWLLLALGSILASLIFADLFVFPVANSMFVLLMLALFAGGCLVPVWKFRKLKANKPYILGVLAALVVPVAYAYFYVFPLLSSAMALLFLFMHLVLASGIILAFSHRGAIKKTI